MLKRCLYGTRDAPARLEALYIKRLREMVFSVGTASSCCFYHPALDVRCVVHGDDFTFSGDDNALDHIQRCMEKAFLCKIEGRGVKRVKGHSVRQECNIFSFC